MTISKGKERFLHAILNCFETGKPDPDHGAIALLRDGKKVNGQERRQVSYGAHQATEDSGHLRNILDAYAAAGGAYANAMWVYRSRLGQPTGELWKEQEFLNLLKLAGKDPIMWKVQDDYFRQNFYVPALNWAQSQKFEEHLSLLVIFDSHVQSGSIPMWLRVRFKTLTPKFGGNERNWIRNYLSVRGDWLRYNSNEARRNSVYRVDNLLATVRAGDWGLERVFIAHGVPVDPGRYL